MRNRYPGICYKCGKEVPPGFGFFEKGGKYANGKTVWRVQCVKCCDGRNVKETDKEVQRIKKEQLRKRTNLFEHTWSELE